MSEEPDPQQHIVALRARLLGGRGPGASPGEMEAHQHQRVEFGGLPVPAAREQESLATARAREDPVDEVEARASRDLARLHSGPPAREASHRRPGRRRAETGYAVVLGALIGFVVGVRLSRRRARERHPGGVR